MDEIKRARINACYDKVYKLYEDGEYETASKEIKFIIDELKKYYTSEQQSYSFEHILEAYLFTYFKQKDIVYAECNIGAIYRLQGLLYTKRMKYDKAMFAYDKALKFNPVNLDLLFELSELYKVSSRTNSVKKITNEAYDYCVTRADMSRYYRNLGYYYLERYKPGLAMALYQYSNVYYHTQTAEDEIAYLNKATEKAYEEMSVGEMQFKIKESNIPLGPNQDTLNLVYQVGQLMIKENAITDAIDCFTMIYDVTLDREIKAIIDGLQA